MAIENSAPLMGIVKYRKGNNFRKVLNESLDIFLKDALRVTLKDPKDDFLLELAVESGSQYIVTFNTRDFEGCERFGIKVVTPQELLKRLEAIR